MVMQMKSRPKKVWRSFRIQSWMNKALINESRKQNVTQTFLLEQALRDKLVVK